MIEALQAEPRIAVDDSDRAGDGSATADLIRSPREFAGLAEEWRELFASSGCDNVFLSYEWMSAWWAFLRSGIWQIPIFATDFRLSFLLKSVLRSSRYPG